MMRLIGTAIFTSLVLLTTPLAAQPQPAPWANKFFLPGIEKNPSQEAPPVIAHDFGTVPRGTLCIHKFSVTNVYDVPMQIVDIRRSCGCLEAYPPQKVLQPFETAEFIVTMDTSKFSGPNAPLVYVTFGPRFVSTAILRVQGNSRADVTVNPGSIGFGTVAQGAQASQSVALEYSGKQRDWKVTGVVAPTGPLVIQVREAERSFLWGAKYYVTVALKPDAPAGPLSEVVTLQTNDPAAPLVQVNVTGIVQAPLTLSTDKVDLGKVRVGETAEVKVIVRAAGNQEFRLQAIAEDADGVSVEPFPARTAIQITTVRFRPSKVGPVRKEVILRSDLSGGAAVRLVIVGEGVPAETAGQGR